ncbi:MAG: hypothetical protein LBG79_07760 [Spirochaetaceae bacterium]|jgi:predicted membrane channel-forming protein YqfA (hemolysin III family)|nr:hypothetical protein [Spirochaetaceae bacterium]
MGIPVYIVSYPTVWLILSGIAFTVIFVFVLVSKSSRFDKILFFIGLGATVLLVILAFVPNIPPIISFWHWLLLVILFIVGRVHHFKTKKRERESKKSRNTEQLLADTDALLKSIEQKKIDALRAQRDNDSLVK